MIEDAEYQSRFGHSGRQLQGMQLADNAVDILVQGSQVHTSQRVLHLLLSDLLPFSIGQARRLSSLLISFVELLEHCEILLLERVFNGSLDCGDMFHCFFCCHRLIPEDIAIAFQISLTGPDQLLFLLVQGVLQDGYLFSNEILVPLVLLGPLLRQSLGLLPICNHLVYFNIQLLPIFHQQAFNLLDCFAGSLNLVLSVLAVDGAFRADWSVAGETIIGELLFWVIVARVSGLVESFFGTPRSWVAGLRDWCRRIHPGSVVVFWLFSPGVGDGFVSRPHRHLVRIPVVDLMGCIPVLYLIFVGAGRG